MSVRSPSDAERDVRHRLGALLFRLALFFLKGYLVCAKTLEVEG